MKTFKQFLKEQIQNSPMPLQKTKPMQKATQNLSTLAKSRLPPKPTAPPKSVGPSPVGDNGSTFPQIDRDFDSIVDKVFKSEGGYNNVKGDRGGETNFGISKRQYPNVDIKNLTRDKAKEIYKKDYYDKVPNIRSMSPGQKYAAFDTYVNHDPKFASQALQKSGGDVKKLLDVRTQKYQSLAKKPKQKKFLKGWLNRVKEVGASASELNKQPEKPINSAEKSMQIASRPLSQKTQIASRE